MKVSKSSISDKAAVESIIILEIPEFPNNALYDRAKASVPKTSSIRPDVSISPRVIVLRNIYGER